MKETYYTRKINERLKTSVTKKKIENPYGSGW
jgi:hypothetical protein